MCVCMCVSMCNINTSLSQVMGSSASFPRFFLSEPLTHADSLSVPASPPMQARYHMPEEEIRCVCLWCHGDQLQKQCSCLQ